MKKSNVFYKWGIDGISRKFALVSEKCSMKNFFGPATYFGARILTKSVVGAGTGKVNNLFIRKYPRMTPPTSDEMRIHTAFAQAKSWADAAMKDVTAISHNALVWLTVKQNPTATVGGVYVEGLSSQRGLLMRYAIAQVIAGETLPSNHQLPDPVIP